MTLFDADIFQCLNSSSFIPKSHKISTPLLFTLFRSISTLFIHIRSQSHVTRKIAALSRHKTAATPPQSTGPRDSFLRHRGSSIGNTRRPLAWSASNGDRRVQVPMLHSLRFHSSSAAVDPFITATSTFPPNIFREGRTLSGFPLFWISATFTFRIGLLCLVLQYSTKKQRA